MYPISYFLAFIEEDSLYTKKTTYPFERIGGNSINYKGDRQQNGLAPALAK